jgi:serine/threonine protein phosphatase 1
LARGGIHFLDARGPDDTVVYAIGDVHGRLDLLTRLYDSIAADRKKRAASDWLIVHLGDYVDRGPDSKGVIDFILAAGNDQRRIASVAGNHDLSMLDFLKEGTPDGVFVEYGGKQTARSYGVELDFSSPKAFAASHAKLVAAVPQSHRDFLQALPYTHVAGDFFFCHAGIRPGIALDAQVPSDLIWIRREFHRHVGLYEKIVVHGHTPVVEPEVMPNRVNVDTGAYASGVLTALVIEGSDKQILSVGNASA